MSFDLSLPEQSLKAALVMSLLSVWVLVGLFAYLNRYTRRRYFTIWTAAWLFYALWLTLCISLQDAPASPLLLMLKQWCIGAAAVFLLWGSSRFLRLRGRQRLFGLFLGFLGVWSYLSAFEVSDPLWMQLPVFELIGWASVLAGSCFWRVRRRRPYLGAGLLATGFSLWGAYLASYPLLERSIEWLSAGFFISAVLQLFIAVSMIVLVLEQARRQVRLAAQRIRAQEEARTRLEAQLRQAEKLSALGRVIAGVAHELNNPLAVINGYLELILARSELTAPTRSDLEKVAHESQRAAKLVSNFLSFARRQPAQRNLTDLSELVRRVVELRRLSLSDTLVSWTLNLAPDLPPVMVDADQIQQVIVNLVNNALHAVQDGASPGVLTLRTRCSGEVVELCVQDNGPGVPASIAPHNLRALFHHQAGWRWQRTWVVSRPRHRSRSPGAVVLCARALRRGVFRRRAPGGTLWSSRGSARRGRRADGDQRSGSAPARRCARAGRRAGDCRTARRNASPPRLSLNRVLQP